MTGTVTLAPLDGAHRVRLDEAAWAGLVAGAPPSALPAWLAPLDGVDAVVVNADPSLQEALDIRGRALVCVDIAASAGSTGLLASVWTDGEFDCSIARAVRVDTDSHPEAATALVPGVEISVYPIGSLLDEVMRLVPPTPDEASGVPELIPEEFSIALVRAVRAGDMGLVGPILGDLGLTEVPPAVADLIAEIDGHLLVSVTSRSDSSVSVGSWLKGRRGWIEIARTSTGHIRHVPAGRADVRDLLLSSLTGRLGAELDRRAGGGAP